MSRLGPSGLHELFSPPRPIGIDSQREQIELARALAERRGVADRTDFRSVDPGTLPFEESTFDVVFSMGAFLQIPDKEGLYGDIFRVLRPVLPRNGPIALVAFSFNFLPSGPALRPSWRVDRA